MRARISFNDMITKDNISSLMWSLNEELLRPLVSDAAPTNYGCLFFALFYEGNICVKWTKEDFLGCEITIRYTRRCLSGIVLS